jgi:hypothetical protein
MFELQDECSVRHDRPTFAVHVPRPVAVGMSFESFKELKSNVPESFMRRRFEEVPHASKVQTFEYAATLAERDFRSRLKMSKRYEETMEQERKGMPNIPKISLLQTERRNGAIDQDSDMIDPGLPQMD